MNADRRILTPAAASIVAGLVVAVATLGGTIAGDGAAPKADRFATMGDILCANEVWPNLSAQCLAWSEGELVEGSVRFVTLASTNAVAGTTTLTRVAEETEAY